MKQILNLKTREKAEIFRLLKNCLNQGSWKFSQVTGTFIKGDSSFPSFHSSLWKKGWFAEQLTEVKLSKKQCFRIGPALKWPPWIPIHMRDVDTGSGPSSYKITKKTKSVEYLL